MKKFLLWLPAMAIFAGCANQDLTNVTDRSQTAVLTAEKTPLSDGGSLNGESSFRTVIDLPDINILKNNTIYWNAGDLIGLFALGTNGYAGEIVSSNDYCFQYTGTGGKASGDSTSTGLFQKYSGGNNANINVGKYIAYYPFSLFREVYFDASQHNLILNLPSQIDTGSGTFSNFGVGAIMYGVSVVDLDQATATTLNSNQNKWNKSDLSSKIRFQHATSALVFRLDGIPTNETVYQIIVKSDKYDQILNRSFMLSELSKMTNPGSPTPAIKLFTGGTSGASVAATGGKYVGIMLVSPGMAGEKFNISVLTNKGHYNAASFNAPAGGLVAGAIYGITRTVDYQNPWTKSTYGTALEVWDGTSYSVPCVTLTTDHPSPEGDIIIRTPDELEWIAKVFNHLIPTYDWGGLNTDATNGGNYAFQGCHIYIQNDIDMGNNTWASLTATNTGFKGTFVPNGHNIYNKNGVAVTP